MFSSACVRPSVYACMCACTRIRACACAHTRTCIHACKGAYMHARTRECTWSACLQRGSGIRAPHLLCILGLGRERARELADVAVTYFWHFFKLPLYCVERRYNASHRSMLRLHEAVVPGIGLKLEYDRETRNGVHVSACACGGMSVHPIVPSAGQSVGRSVGRSVCDFLSLPQSLPPSPSPLLPLSTSPCASVHHLSLSMTLQARSSGPAALRPHGGPCPCQGADHGTRPERRDG